MRLIGRRAGLKQCVIDYSEETNESYLKDAREKLGNNEGIEAILDEIEANIDGNKVDVDAEITKLKGNWDTKNYNEAGKNIGELMEYAYGSHHKANGGKKKMRRIPLKFFVLGVIVFVVMVAVFVWICVSRRRIKELEKHMAAIAKDRKASNGIEMTETALIKETD